MIVTLAVLALLSALVFSLLNTFVVRRRRARLAAQWGCQPPVQHGDGKWWQAPLGVYPIMEFLHYQTNYDTTAWQTAFWKRMAPANTFAWRFPDATNIFTIEPANVQAMLATQFKDFDVHQRGLALNPLIAKGIFTTDRDEWKHSRALLRPQFVREQVADLDAEEHHMQDLFKQIPIRADGYSDIVDMRPLFFRQSLDSATEFLFGESCNSQLLAGVGGEKLENRFGKDSLAFSNAFDRGTNAVTVRVFLGNLYWLYNPKSYRDDYATVHQFVDYYVKLGLEASKDPAASEKPRSKYVFLHELVKETRDPLELRSQLINILLAGRDTTSGTLGWAVYTLARHPDIYAKLRAVILETFGTYTHPRNLDFASLKGCTYLQYFLNETLRLYPAVPGNLRHASVDTTLPVGGGPDGKSPVFVHKGQSVVYNVHTMHRRKDLWGEDALEFKPDRWKGRKSGFEYLPFNAGPRICLGQQHALTNMGFTLVRLLQRYEKVEAMDSRPERATVTLTTTPRECLVRYKLADE